MGCKWFLSQNQQVQNEFFGYRWYEALAKKTLKGKEVSARTILKNQN